MEIQPHIHCKKGDISKIVLLPGDPKRVHLIGQLMNDVKEVSNNREYLTIRGKYKSIDITVTSSGIGCPGAAIAVEELINCGAEVIIRVGTCGGLKSSIQPGDLIIAEAAMRSEGTTKEYIDSSFPAIANRDVTRALEETSKNLGYKYHIGIDRTHDAFYENINNFLSMRLLYKDPRAKDWPIPLVSSEMECSAVFLISYLRGIKAGAVLAVNTIEPLDSDYLDENPESIYRLIPAKEKSINGIERSIKVALEASVKLASH